MAESETQKEEEDKKAETEQEESGPAAQCKRIFNANSAKHLGTGLRYLIIAIWALHIHVFWCFTFCVCIIAGGIYDDTDDTPFWIILLVFMWFPMGTAVTPAIVVFLINSVGGFYDEIQSWEVAYISWGACCTLFYGPVLVVAAKDSSAAGALLDALSKFLLYPFGIRPRDAGDSIVWSSPLVSVAPSLVSGFFANFILQPKYFLECNEAYGPISDPDSCFNDGAICCVAISSHTEPAGFFAGLASTVLAAWGVVKIIGHFICLHDDEVKFDKDDEEKTKRMMKDVLSTKSGRDLLAKSISLSERGPDDTKKDGTEAGAV